MDLEFLADNKDAIPVLAVWFFQEWGHSVDGNTLELEQEKLRGFANRDRIPLAIVAKHEGEVVGAAQLKYRERDIFPEKEHWLGAVYVAPAWRGRNVAEQIISRLVEVATELGVTKLYLQTERLDGGLYRRLDWQPVEVVTYHGVEVLVMVRALGRRLDP